jgi:lauroyl/myristoyl acyltransferase
MFSIFLVRLIAILPLPVLHALGRLIGRLVYACPGKYRQRLRANATQAGYPGAAFARQAAQINIAMEDLIRRFPQQYLWGYNRYKTPRGAPSSLDAQVFPA